MVPPSCQTSGIGGTVMAMMRFSASMTPWMLPPFSRSMRGKRVGS
jgi:hypothetical protein